MTWKRIGLLLIAAMLLAGGTVLSQSSADFTVNWSVIGGGGGESATAGYRLEGTIGQSPAHSTSAGSNYRVEGGFWAAFSGVDAPSGPGGSLFLPLVVK
jgi:hypothetical protein